MLRGAVHETAVSFITAKLVHGRPSICTVTAFVVAAKLYPERVTTVPPKPLDGATTDIIGPARNW